MKRSSVSHRALWVLTLGIGLTVLPSQSRAQTRLEDKLDKPVHLKGLDANTALKDVLEFLMDRYDVTILIDRSAFKPKRIEDVEAAPIRLPKLTDVSLGTVLD